MIKELHELDNILQEAISSLDNGEKVQGLEYARSIVNNAIVELKHLQSK